MHLCVGPGVDLLQDRSIDVQEGACQNQVGHNDQRTTDNETEPQVAILGKNTGEVWTNATGKGLTDVHNTHNPGQILWSD